MKRTITNPISGEEVTFTQWARETNYEKTVVEIKVEPGSLGPPPHYHEAYTETFRVISGRLEIEIEGKKQTLTTGGVQKIEKFQLHRFGTRKGETAHIEVTIEPGHEGFEQGLSVLFGLARDGKTDNNGAPKRITDLLTISEMSDTKIRGPVATIVSLLSLFIGDRTRAKTRERLVNEYYRS